MGHSFRSFPSLFFLDRKIQTCSYKIIYYKTHKTMHIGIIHSPTKKINCSKGVVRGFFFLLFCRIWVGWGFSYPVWASSLCWFKKWRFPFQFILTLTLETSNNEEYILPLRLKVVIKIERTLLHLMLWCYEYIERQVINSGWKQDTVMHLISIRYQFWGKNRIDNNRKNFGKKILHYNINLDP